ncbi:glutathione synthase/RimK-type ligase-like ATP-grasp enzyme [Nocardiopsis mwathae]|uniref:Glutathione synthase/RimK-type ligase-like ATP-grasp enzyme n=1 Tax=Nocardiopsis mwathae TaxID=1472723 RepID=A0A7W9YJN9_9ACTN|nr:hypothetical protein [Nocardiopsis mwathae]MBB6173383.1 glutathione synthase/RimK-type ligase-like ATP-grasp enzyme [Nocardiopsis mwathae]
MRRLPVHTIPADDQERCLALLADLDGLDGVEFVHGLNIDRTHIRNGRVHHGGLCLNDLDLYVWYAQIDRGPHSYHLEALENLSRDTRVIVDPEGLANGVDKHRAHLALRRAGVAVPDSVLIHQGNVAAAEPVLAEWGKAVLKPRRGYFGTGVLLIDGYPTLRDLVGYLTSAVPTAPDGTYLLERFYDNDPADWISATVINGSLMYGYRKRPHRWAQMGGGAAKVYDPGGEGGGVDACEVPPAYAEQALRAQKALGAHIIGFDMILHGGSPIIVDENTYPALYPELFRAAGKDLGLELFRMVSHAIEDVRTGART